MRAWARVSTMRWRSPMFVTEGRIGKNVARVLNDDNDGHAASALPSTCDWRVWNWSPPPTKADSRPSTLVEPHLSKPLREWPLYIRTAVASELA